MSPFSKRNRSLNYSVRIPMAQSISKCQRVPTYSRFPLHGQAAEIPRMFLNCWLLGRVTHVIANRFREWKTSSSWFQQPIRLTILMPHYSAQPEHDEKVAFTCPMHPDVKSNSPGNCPICGMQLIPVSNSGSGQAMAHGAHGAHGAQGHATKPLDQTSRREKF